MVHREATQEGNEVQKTSEVQHKLQGDRLSSVLSQGKSDSFRYTADGDG